ncbi:MAG: hypothetical protein U0871_07500 [Gemmataceae bacterium]
MSTPPAFLADRRPLAWKQMPASAPFAEPFVHLGNGNPKLEVLVVSAPADRSPVPIRSLWKARLGGRAVPLLVAVVHDEAQVTLCGPVGIKDDPPLRPRLDRGQAERACREALDQPNKEAALRYLRDTLPAVESALPGVRNEGFLATHELERGAPRLPKWADLTTRGRALVGLGDTELLAGLGFELNAIDSLTSLLKASGTNSRAGVAVVLQAGESPDLEAERFNGMSPVTYAMAVADRENLRYVLVCQGPKVRLYPVGLGVGVGRRGRTETFVELHTGLIRDDHAGYIWALLSADALDAGGTLDHLLEESRRFAGDLAVRLRERVYDLVIPELAKGLIAARKLKKPTAADLTETYRMAMTVLFRLLFVAYAEDKDLLPYKWNGLYQSRSLKTKARELLELHHSAKAFDEGDSLWEEVDRLFRAVEDGNTEWGVPAYGGELFSRDKDESPTGARLAGVRLSNTVFGSALRDLLLIETAEGLGPVDFRSLGVREFGTVYEGLLESELAVAETDLTTDREGNYRPARTGDEVKVAKGQVYLHNQSGQRKATGTYFTKEFAVDHLLDEALEPALADHLARLDKLDDTAAAERFFDFRVADIAMGSAHFLVAAVDRIERAFSSYLARRTLPGVRTELATLRAAAETALGELKDQIEIEDTQLLRRQIARRCIYGTDMNPVAVSLARLSIWIHTFVPGLPLSLLDHSLVCGNSLVGVGRVSEIEELVTARSVAQKGPNKGKQLLFGGFDAATLLGDALEPLNKVARIADATLADVRRARAALKEAEKAVASAAALCDIVTACRLTCAEFPFDSWSWDEEKDRLTGAAEHANALKALEHLPPFHFPIAFPEVFLRDRSGFDVLLGNPPWEKARVEEHAFWARHQPGLRSLSPREREARQTGLRKERGDLAKLLEEETATAEALRKALLNGPYPGMGSGDPDLYKAFCWRFWHLIASDGGRTGVVLPRGALAAKGSHLFRVEVFGGSRQVIVTTLVNSRQWVFDEVHPQYTVGLVAVCRGTPDGHTIGLRGPFNSLERFEAGHRRPPTLFSAADVASWTDTVALPLLPTDESLAVFAQLRTHPRLDFNDKTSWRARPYTEVHATNDKHLFDMKSEECPEGFWPVYKGESFDVWEPDTGTYYGWADPTKVLPELLATQKRGARSKASPFSEFPADRIGKQELLACQFPRIAFRDNSRATDSRTVRAALVPPRVFIVHLAPSLLFPRGTKHDVAYLLGVLSSLPLDWYARRFVELHLTYHVLNPFPIPRPAEDNPLRKRVVALAGRLAAVDERFTDWAKAVRVACGPLDDATRDDHVHELDAVVAHLYGLTEPQLVHVFETFHEGWDYMPWLAATLKHYTAWAKNK